MARWSEVSDEVGEALERYAGPAPEAAPEPGLAAVYLVILEEGTTANKAAELVAAIEEEGWMGPKAFATASVEELKDGLEPRGLWPVPKALIVAQRLAKWLVDRHKGDVAELDGVDDSELRGQLMTVRGLGTMTAQAILSRGLGRPSYPLDKPTFRIMVRHGWADVASEFDEVGERLQRAAEYDVERIGTWARGMAKVGAKHCKPSVPKCDRCPLAEWLPEGGPVAIE